MVEVGLINQTVDQIFSNITFVTLIFQFMHKMQRWIKGSGADTKIKDQERELVETTQRITILHLCKFNVRLLCTLLRYNNQ